MKIVSFTQIVIVLLVTYNVHQTEAASCQYKGGDVHAFLDKIKTSTNTKSIYVNSANQVYLDCILEKSQVNHMGLSTEEEQIVTSWQELLDREVLADNEANKFSYGHRKAI